MGLSGDMKLGATCDAKGNWSISNEVPDVKKAYVFITQMEFGHIENRDFRTFKPIATEVTENTKVGKDRVCRMARSGTGDSVIGSHFNEINAMRPTITFFDDFWSPVYFRNDAFLCATPGQPYEP